MSYRFVCNLCDFVVFGADYIRIQTLSKAIEMFHLSKMNMCVTCKARAAPVANVSVKIACLKMRSASLSFKKLLSM